MEYAWPEKHVLTDVVVRFITVGDGAQRGEQVAFGV